MSLPDRRRLELATGQIWLITEGSSGLGNIVATKLKEQGQTAVILQFPSPTALTTAEVTTGEAIAMLTLTATTENHLQDNLKTIQTQFGQIGGLIHIQEPPQVETSGADLFPDDQMERVQSIYFLTKCLKSSLSQGYFAVVTQVDGQLATSGEQAYSVVASGLSGFVKALHREWSDLRCRFLDLSPQLELETAAQIVLAEIADPDRGLVEVGRSQEQRMTLCLEQENVKSEPVKKIDRDRVFLVSGGGRGITSDCVLTLAKAERCKFILLGRTLLSPTEPEWADGCTDKQELQQRSIEYLTQNGQNSTPVIVNKLVNSVISQREIASTIERIKQLGSEAIYWSTDITNKVQLETDLKTIESSFGKITGLIHGAGNLADKRIEKKTLADWNDVFGSKIIGLKNLLSVLDLNDLQQIILFSSVAGYFGNAGQTDYALANEILNKFAYSCQALYPHMQVTSIDWGPWERGMMNPILQKYYQEQGIDLIPMKIGAEFCQQELSIAKACQTPQVVISGSLSIPANYTLQQQQADTFDRYLSVQNNPFLKDHRVGNDAVLPMTCAIDWMVKACEDRLPNYKIRSVSNFQVLKGIRFTPDSDHDYTLDIKPLKKEQDGFEYEIQIDSFSQENARRLHHYKGIVALSKQLKALPVYPSLNLDLALNCQIESFYGDNNSLFHGPTFQGVQQVLRISDRSIVSQCRLKSISLEQQGQFAINSFNPYIADVQLQNALIWAYHYLNQRCLPTKVEQVEQFCEIDFNKDFYVSTEIIESSKFQIVVDIFACDVQGNILMKWSRVFYTMMKKLTTSFWGGESEDE